jgi:hypothetical protein
MAGTGTDGSRKARKNLNIKELFKNRMKREGRWTEWLAVLADVKQEMGRLDQATHWEAMRRMGYKSPYIERKKWRKYEALHFKAIAFVEEERLKREMAEMKRLELETVEQEQAKIDFETAFIGLPNVAPPNEEWDWIGAHPAMMRQDRAPDKLKSVNLTADDVLKAPHGPAPSKRAVNQLQHWCNAPREFYKAMIGVHKKQQEGDSGGAAGHGDEDLSVVEEMLNNLKKERR